MTPSTYACPTTVYVPTLLCLTGLNIAGIEQLVRRKILSPSRASGCEKQLGSDPAGKEIVETVANDGNGAPSIGSPKVQVLVDLKRGKR